MAPTSWQQTGNSLDEIPWEMRRMLPPWDRWQGLAEGTDDWHIPVPPPETARDIIAVTPIPYPDWVDITEFLN